MKSVKSVSSKEITRIPKPKSVVKDTRPIQNRCTTKPPVDKKFSIRRPSKLGVAERSDQNTKLGESRIDVSNRPSSTSSIGKSVQNFGKVPSYLKRANSMKRDSNATDKVKAFNALKTRLRAAQSQFFKALGNVKQTQPDGLQEEYKFIALIKNGEGKLVMDENRDAPKIDGGIENKNFISIKEKLSLMTTDVNMVLGTIAEQLRVIQNPSFDGELLDIKKDFVELQDKIESISAANVSYCFPAINSIRTCSQFFESAIRLVE